MTRSRRILLLVAAMCIVTSSRDISARIQSDNTTCLLEMDGTDVLQELLEGDAVFINIKLLSFVDASDSVGMDFYENTTVIDVNHWVVAVGKIGELLSTFPFDFEYLSLGTLTPGVEHISLNVTSIPECFFDVDNEDKLNIIAKSLLQLESDENVKQDVCIERQLTRDNFSVSGVYGVPACYYTLLQGSTYFECWQISGEDSSVELSNFVTHFWLDTFFWISVVFTFYFNLFFVSFFCRVKPMVDNEKQYLSIRTDLPMGFKYLMFYKGNQYTFVFVSRWLVLLVLVAFLQYIPYIIAHVSDSDNFTRRWAAIFNNEVIQESTFWGWNIYVNLVYFIFGVILMITWLNCQNWFETKYIESIMRDHFFLEEFNLAPDLKIPKDNYSGLYRFLFVVKERTKMAVSISHWKHGLKGFWKSLSFINNKVLQYTVAAILVVPFLCIYTIGTAVNSIPLFYCMLRFFQIWVIDDNMKLSNRVLMISASFGLLFVEIALLGKFVSIFAYVSGIVCYFCIGLLVNSGTAGVFVAVSVIVIGYVISTLTDYYKGYVVLLQQVISVLDELITDNMVQVSSDKLPSFPQCTDQINNTCIPLSTVVDFQAGGNAGTSTGPSTGHSTGPSTDPNTQPTSTPTPSNGTPAPAPSSDSTSLPVIRQDTEGLTAIEKTLFDLIVQKYRPTGIQILTVIMQLLILSLVIWVGFSTLKLIEDFTDLNQQVELFAGVVIAGIVPLFQEILRNKAEEESRQKIREKCIRRDIEEYLANGTFQTLVI
ncbi:uncharacterized protein [Antedon mediterranea]|uniref:uncharacterized protein n=1 Tax=Antedon mediterranea TaxID=105859 RepID=UPI003AF9B682